MVTAAIYEYLRYTISIFCYLYGYTLVISAIYDWYLKNYNIKKKKRTLCINIFRIFMGKKNSENW